MNNLANECAITFNQRRPSRIVVVPNHSSGNLREEERRLCSPAILSSASRVNTTSCVSNRPSLAGRRAFFMATNTKSGAGKRWAPVLLSTPPCLTLGASGRKPDVRNLRGAAGNVIHGGMRNPPRNRKGGSGHSSPTGAHASAPPDAHAKLI